MHTKHNILTLAVLILLAIVSINLMVLDNKTLFFGQWVNRLSPCQQNEFTSVPCYAKHDLLFMLITGGMAAGFTLAGMLLVGKMIKEKE